MTCVFVPLSLQQINSTEIVFVISGILDISYIYLYLYILSLDTYIHIYIEIFGGKFFRQPHADGFSQPGWGKFFFGVAVAGVTGREVSVCGRCQCWKDVIVTQITG